MALIHSQRLRHNDKYDIMNILSELVSIPQGYCIAFPARAFNQRLRILAFGRRVKAMHCKFKQIGGYFEQSKFELLRLEYICSLNQRL